MLINKLIRYFFSFTNIITKYDKVRSKPIHAQIEPTTYCNLDCPACRRSSVIKDSKHMALSDFQKIIEEIAPLNLMLNGFGEPLMHPQINKFIELAKDRNVSINLTTNGTILHKRAKELIESGLDLLSISMDAATPEIYKSIRGEDMLGKIESGIQEINGLRKKYKRKKPGLRANFLIQDQNINQIDKFVGYCKEIGIDIIYFQLLNLIGPLETRYKKVAGDLSFNSVIRCLKAAQKKAWDLKILTNLSYIIDVFAQLWNKDLQKDTTFTSCMSPWISTYVTVEGNIRPCSFNFSGYECNLGNIFKTQFDEIWNGDKYQSFRKSLKEKKNLPSSCRNCIPKKFPYIFLLRKISPGFMK